MKLQKLVVDLIPVEHGLFRYSRKSQSQKNGSYTVTTSLACFQWLLRYIISPPQKTGKENPLRRLNRSAGKKKVIHHTQYIYF